MFGMYEDRRTPEERRRDMELGDKRRAEKLLALGVMKNTIRPLLLEKGIETGLAGMDIYQSDMLMEIDGVTYKLSVSVDHDE